MAQFISRKGICFQWRLQDYWSDSNTTKAADITTQYNTLTQYFPVLHTYQLCGWDGGQYKDLESPGAGTVLSLAAAANKKAGSSTIQLIQGTLDGVLTNFPKNATDASNWANTLFQACGSDVEVTLNTIGAIVIGNEIDMQPAATATSIASCMNNLYAGLDALGLGSIPITSTFANIGTKTYPNSVAEALVDAIVNNWQPGWNGGVPFVFANHYTANMDSTDASTATDYITNARTYYNGKTTTANLVIHVGEMGYSAYYGDTNEADVVNDFFTWMGTQDAGSPVCIFQGYDAPNATPAFQTEFGLFDTTTNAAKSNVDLSLLPSS